MQKVLVTVCSLLLLLPGPAMAVPAAREVVGRMTLIPVGPGAMPSGAPVYDPAGLPAAKFEVYIDNELGTLDVEDYLQARAQLVGAHYAVWLYRFDAEGAEVDPIQPSATLVIEPDKAGRFPLGAPAIMPGRTYAWQVVAEIRDGQGGQVQLWSSLLYFHTAPAETLLPALLGGQAQPLCGELIDMAAQQQRAQAALATRLRGLHLYGNYPSASDTFFCTPLVEEDALPYLHVGANDELPLPLLLELGRIMPEVAALKQLPAEGLNPAQLADLAGRVYALVGRWPELTVASLGRKLSTLAAVAEKLDDSGGQNPDEVTAVLNEMLLAIDGTVGGGTATGSSRFDQSFVSYAGQAARRLERLSELETQFQAVLGIEESDYWLEYFEQQREHLNTLAEEVERGRLSKSLLSDQIRELRWGRMEAGEDAFRYLTGLTCRVATDRILRLTPADTAQVSRLQAEIVRCHLLRLADYLWPEIH